MKTFSAAAIAMLVTFAFPALAAGPTPERQARFEQWCQANPEKCREVQARHEQCRADPEKCRAEMQAKREARRAQCQANPDQCRAEMQARREQWCQANPEKCREVQARREQCKADPEKCRAEFQARIQERFNKADTNGDGRVSRDEAASGMLMVARHFDQIDANKDGVVTIEELQAARKARTESRRGHKI